MKRLIEAYLTLNVRSSPLHVGSKAPCKVRSRISRPRGAAKLTESAQKFSTTTCVKNLPYLPDGPQRTTRTFQPGQDKHELPVQVLGSSTKVLVLTDAAQTSKQRKIEETRVKAVTKHTLQDGPSPVDLLESTKEKDGAPDSTEVTQHLEDLRTTLSGKKNSEGLLTLEQYKEAKAALRASFSHRQLKEYYSSFRKSVQSDNRNELPSGTSQLYESHTWTQGVSPFPETALARLKSTGDTHLLPHAWARGKIIDKILHFCWGYRSEEEFASEGELDLRISAGIREIFFNLHGNGVDSLFARIASEYGARIDVSRSSGVLRITANYKSCHATLRLIVFALENIRSDTIEVSLDDACNGVTMPILSAAQLETIWAKVAKLTNTTIDAARSKERASLVTLTVRSMGPSDADFITAQRLVARAIDALKQKIIPLFHEPYAIDSLRCTEIASAKPSSLAGDKTLFRWTLPEPFGKEVTGNNSQPAGRTPKGGVPSEIFEGLKSQSKSLANELIPIANVEREPYWHKVFSGANDSHRVSASFGLLTFSHMDPPHASSPGQSQPQVMPDFQKSNTHTRNLIPGTANMSGLVMQFADLQPNLLDQLKIRLVPQTYDDFQLRERPPILDIGVRYDRAAASSTLSPINLIHGMKAADLMIPQFHTDARFGSHQVTRQNEDTKFNWRPTIQKFVVDNGLDVWGANLTNVTPEIVLPLPLTPAENTLNDNATPVTHVRYQILSLDYMSQLRFNRAGIKMVYSKILPSELDEPREELAFQMTQPISTSVETLRKTFEQFFNTIVMLANNVRSGDYLQSFAAKGRMASEERTEAERVLSDVMRSAAADAIGTRGRLGARQDPSRVPVDKEIDLLLERIGTHT